MIAKSRMGSSFKGLMSYLSQPNKMEWLEQRNCGIEDETMIAKNMQLTAGLNSRVQKPVYHVSISWSEFDSPTKSQMVDVADRFLQHMNLEEHQAAIVCHSDTAHPHIHLMINRVHHETEKVWENFTYIGEGRDRKIDKGEYQRREEFLRKMEKEYGWEITEGKHAGGEKEFDGKAPELWEIKQQKKIQKLAGKMGIQQADGRSVKERADELKDQLYQATSFAELDKVLATNGLWIARKGQGAVFTDGTHKIKSSSISRGLSGPKLEARFNDSLKAYVADRERLIGQDKGKAMLTDWTSLQARMQLEGAEDVTQKQADIINSQLKRLETYDGSLEAVRKEIRDSFNEAFDNGKKAYGAFGQYVSKEGFDEAQAELIANPQMFGKVADLSGVVKAGEAIREFESLQGRYSNHITEMAKAERKGKLNDLQHKSRQLGQQSESLANQLSQGKSARAFKNSLQTYFREGLQETEAGRSIDSSVINTISLARALQNPKSLPKQLLSQSGKNMTTEAGQVTNQAMNEGAKYLKNAGEILANPGTGSIKLFKNVIQSSLRQITKTGRGKGLGR